MLGKSVILKMISLLANRGIVYWVLLCRAIHTALEQFVKEFGVGFRPRLDNIEERYDDMSLFAPPSLSVKASRPQPDGKGQYLSINEHYFLTTFQTIDNYEITNVWMGIERESCSYLKHIILIIIMMIVIITTNNITLSLFILIMHFHYYA